MEAAAERKARLQAMKERAAAAAANRPAETAPAPANAAPPPPLPKPQGGIGIGGSPGLLGMPGMGGQNAPSQAKWGATVMAFPPLFPALLAA